MKKVYSLTAAMLLGALAFSQCLVTVTGSTNVKCFGSCNGSASVTTVGMSPYKYLWAPGGQTTQNPNNLCAGTNTVTMTDNSSCVSTATVTITQPAVLNDSTLQSNVPACDSCNGTATAYPYGGTSPYTYKWTTTPMQVSATATGLCPGTYMDTIWDVNNCMKVLSVTITQAATLTVSTTVNNVSTSTACDGGISASPSGGNGPYTYAWSPGGQTTSAIIAQCAGNYSVCVTDAKGCTKCNSAAIVIGVTGINETSIANRIHISPNPSAGQFTIVFDEPMTSAKICVTNILGEKVFESTINTPKSKIDLSNKPNGDYFLQIKTENGIATKKIIINK